MEWLKNRFRYAFAGVKLCLQDASIRFQMLLGLLAILAGLLLRISIQGWLWILLSITLVVTTEILNSCLEKTVDYISTDIHPLAKKIKDMAAATVLCASGFALAAALLVYIPALMELVK